MGPPSPKLKPGAMKTAAVIGKDLASCQILFGEDADFKKQAMHTKSLRQDAGDSRQDGGALHRRTKPEARR